MNNKRISILGCGWLGLPLAKRLVSLGYEVKGSSTDQDKRQVLQQHTITPYIFQFKPELVASNQDEDILSFFDADILFLNIPFRRDLPDPEVYFLQNKAVKKCLEKSDVKKVIFASSTSVYPNIGRLISESDHFTPDNERASVLLKTEHLFNDDHRFETVILRFAGLYGASRKIGRNMFRKGGLSGGNNPVNLVHLEDCIGIIAELINKNIGSDVLNVCSDEHPTKRDVYIQAAKKLKLEPPTFNEEGREDFKIVNNEKVKSLLNYQFSYPSPLS